MAVQKSNFRRLLRTVESLADLGPEMTAERDFAQTARAIVSALLQAGSAREAVLFRFSDKPSMLTSIASEGLSWTILRPYDRGMAFIPHELCAYSSPTRIARRLCPT